MTCELVYASYEYSAGKNVRLDRIKRKTEEGFVMSVVSVAEQVITSCTIRLTVLLTIYIYKISFKLFIFY